MWFTIRSKETNLDLKVFVSRSELDNNGIGLLYLEHLFWIKTQKESVFVHINKEESNYLKVFTLKINSNIFNNYINIKYSLYV